MSGLPVIVRRRQTTGALAQGLLGLSGSANHFADIDKMVLSPYFQTIDMREEAPDGDTTISILMIKAFLLGYDNGGAGIGVSCLLVDSTGVNTGCIQPVITVSTSDDAISILAVVESTINSYCTTNGIDLPSSFEWVGVPANPRIFSNPSLAVNTARRASTTRDALVFASVEIDSNLSLSGGAKGKVELQYADDSVFTTFVVTCPGMFGGNTGTLTIGLNTTDAAGAVLSGLIPANKYYRLHTTNVTGTPTYGTPAVQEVIL